MGILSAAVAALVLQPGIAEAKKKPVPAQVPAAPVQLPYQSANLPTSAEVRAFYAGWQHGPIWFAGKAPKAAVNDLMAILQRSPLDGLAEGPQYAAQAQAAVNHAVATGTPEAIAFADNTLSEAFLAYAQVMARPVKDMLYGYDYLKPKPATANQVLRIAATPSQQIYLQQVANPNSVYVAMRDAAWRQMQASGSAVPDPRVVANLNRASPMPAKGKFVLVNPATAMLTMFENGVPVDSMKIVVGDYNKNIPRWMPTPQIASVIFYTIHNPYWNAPDHLVRKNIAPRYLADGEKYLDWRGYKVMSDWTTNATVIPAKEVDWKGVASGKVHIRVRQDPGPDNFMGQLKFPFANSEDIFLHDTDPEDRNLFKLSDRAQSNGCVRLEDAHRFGRWLLGHEPVTTSTDAEYAERLPQGVPVYISYLTAQVKDGQLAFVKDIYGWDPPGSSTQVAAGK